MKRLVRSSILFFIPSLIVMALLPGHPTAAPFDDEFLKDAKGMTPYAHQVSSGGYWHRGSEEGFYRLVVMAAGVEQTRHWLYLQWLKADTGTQAYQVVQTLPINELNQGHGYLLKTSSEYPDLNQLKATVTINDLRSRKESYAEITAGPPGSYRFTQR
jgi:hypothetical protein